MEETTYGNCTAPSKATLARALEPMGDPEGEWPPPTQGRAGMTHGSLSRDGKGETIHRSAPHRGKGEVTRGSLDRRQERGGDSGDGEKGEDRKQEVGGGRRDKVGGRGEEQAVSMLPRVVRTAMGED